MQLFDLRLPCGPTCPLICYFALKYAILLNILCGVCLWRICIFHQKMHVYSIYISMTLNLACCIGHCLCTVCQLYQRNSNNWIFKWILNILYMHPCFWESVVLWKALFDHHIKMKLGMNVLPFLALAMFTTTCALLGVVVLIFVFICFDLRPKLAKPEIQIVWNRLSLSCLDQNFNL